MPRAIPVPVRETILSRHQQGHSASRIAEDLDLPATTVRSLIQRLRSNPEALAPSYASDRPDHPLLEEVLDYRRENSQWGGELIRTFLLDDHPKEDVPTARTLQRWLRNAGLSPAPAGRKPTMRRRRSDTPHAVWQVDAVEQLVLASKEKASWLRVVDECSGAFLRTRIFPPGAVE
jgi:transposase